MKFNANIMPKLDKMGWGKSPERIKLAEEWYNVLLSKGFKDNKIAKGILESFAGLDLSYPDKSGPVDWRFGIIFDPFQYGSDFYSRYIESSEKYLETSLFPLGIEDYYYAYLCISEDGKVYFIMGESIDYLGESFEFFLNQNGGSQESNAIFESIR